MGHSQPGACLNSSSRVQRFHRELARSYCKGLTRPWALPSAAGILCCPAARWPAWQGTPGPGGIILWLCFSGCPVSQACQQPLASLFSLSAFAKPKEEMCSLAAGVRIGCKEHLFAQVEEGSSSQDLHPDVPAVSLLPFQPRRLFNAGPCCPAPSWPLSASSGWVQLTAH